MALKNGNKSGRGGKRKGAGRKPKAITLLKRQLIENGKEDAEYAYSLFVTIMRDESQPLELRKDCAAWVADRVMGKPNQAVQLSGEVKGAITVNFINDGTRPA